MAKRRPQGDGTIRKRSDGRLEGRIIVGHKDNGRPLYKSVFGKTQKATLKELHRLIDLYRDVELTEDSRMTLGEWMDKWLDEYMIFTLRDATLNSYRALANNQVKRFLGNKQLSLITTQDIQKMYNDIKKRGRTKKHPLNGYEISDSVVRKIHMMLHEALDVAVKERLIPKNPTNGTSIPKNNYSEKQILDDEQLKIFCEAIKCEELWYDFFYVEIMTGLRKGEICGLKWSDINFSENKLRVQRSVSTKRGGGLNIGETKTSTGTRCIILPPSVREMLIKRKQTAINEWIFPSFLNPTEPINPSLAYTKLKTILKRAELPQIRFHDLRHTFATHAMKGGVDAKTLSGILGHTNASFTLDTYTHVTSDMQKKASAVVGNIMKSLMIKE